VYCVVGDLSTYYISLSKTLTEDNDDCKTFITNVECIRVHILHYDMMLDTENDE